MRILRLPLALAICGALLAACAPSSQGTGDLFSTQDTSNGLPDLAVRNLSVSPTTVAVGGDLTVSFEVANIGNGVSPPTRVSVYLSDTPSITAADTLEGSMDLPSVGPGASIAITAHGRAGQTQGLFYIGVFADDLNRVIELDKSNNTESVAIVVTGP